MSRKQTKLQKKNELNVTNEYLKEEKWGELKPESKLDMEQSTNEVAKRKISFSRKFYLKKKESR